MLTLLLFCTCNHISDSPLLNYMPDVFCFLSSVIYLVITDLSSYSSSSAMALSVCLICYLLSFLLSLERQVWYVVVVV
ncbi:hypothetical protein DFJ43DRAFT_150152 [Lentinula guzmanii]|uniref:Uncharacterized protein n=1 Tax=Lentinula guzmanii TaxID=2804957 RepID=A0AA38N1W1_9AGAR|nr:hypothetical protein DFJ43DRAFT_150152 [Lentinula guzmanii]